MKQIAITLIAFIAATTTLFSQTIQGKAYYTSKTDTQLDFSNREGMPEEIKKRIQEQVKELSSKNYVLSFNTSESIYQEEATLDNNALSDNPFGGAMRMMMNIQDIGILYKNTKTKIYTNQRDVYGKVFLIEDALKNYSWKLEEETKQIGDYLCFKATTTIKVMKRNGGFPGNTPTNEEDASPITEADELATVWYTLDIPIQQGPDKFWGLPGLVLEVTIGDTKILCTKVELSNTSNPLEINPPKNGKEVNQEKFDEILEKKIKELRENFGGPRGSAFRRGN